jgi:large subunit ribosomal protein L6
MSKVGRKPIDITGVSVEVHGLEIKYKGPKASGVHILPHQLRAQVVGNDLQIAVKRDDKTTPGALRQANTLWGLHRALIANEITGARTGFEKQVQIEGLGFKAIQEGNKLVFALGFSHKIDFPLPEGIFVEVEKKTGQLLTIRGSNKELVGLTCSKIRAMKKPEPYKGKGIHYVGEKILRKKERKTKS